MKRLLSLALALVMILCVFTACGAPAPKEPGEHNDLEISYTSISSSELVKEMGIGWNLGNTMDAPDGENAWGQPTTTPEMINKIKELGFNTIRIPVSWGKHTDEEFNIDPEWIRRVQDIVDYAMDNDMYVIINSHHDNDFYIPTKNNDEERGEKFITAIWTQVAEYFKNYDQHLIFECMNEPRLVGTDWEWSIDITNKRCARAVEIINKYNQLFVNIVRESGGRNTDRFLMMSSYAGSPSTASIAEFIIPTDTVEDRLLLSTHSYSPYDLAMGDNPNNDKFDYNGKKSIEWSLNQLTEKFTNAGIPVVITEMGCINKYNPEERYNWGVYYVSKAKELGMVCVWWDNGHDDYGSETYGLFDRHNLKVYDSAQRVYEGLMDGLNGTAE